jgi:SAM-dependent methyltransferase
MSDQRRSAPSTARNRQPILNVLQRVLPENGRVLEVASGAGEHAVHVAAAMPGIAWRPSDPDPPSRASISAWTASAGLNNVLPPLDIDVRADFWGLEHDSPFDAVVAINVVHIAPWEATLGLVAGARRLLRQGGVLFLYGPYKRDGRHTAPSNEAFDASLKSRDPSWGVRDVGDLERAAKTQGLELRETVEMPANNLALVFAKV